jgi:hypothetical protein
MWDLQPYITEKEPIIDYNSTLDNKTPIEYIEELKFSNEDGFNEQINKENKEKRKIAYYNLRPPIYSNSNNNRHNINIYFNIYNGDMEDTSPSLMDDIFRAPQKNIFIGTMYEQTNLETTNGNENFQGTTTSPLTRLTIDQLTFILIKEFGELLDITHTDVFPKTLPEYNDVEILEIQKNAETIKNNESTNMGKIIRDIDKPHRLEFKHSSTEESAEILDNSIDKWITGTMITLYNINEINNQLLIKQEETCANGINECHSSNINEYRCLVPVDGETPNCYKLINKEMYKLNGQNSYIKTDVLDNFDFNIKFLIKIDSDEDDEFIIIKSGNLRWELLLNNNKFELIITDGRGGKHSEIFNNIGIINNETIYNIDLEVTSSKITCSIDYSEGTVSVEDKTLEFITSTLNIYECYPSNINVDTCKRVQTGEYRNIYDQIPIFIGGDPDQPLRYFNGYIGGIQFGTELEKCEFNPNDHKVQHMIQSECIEECEKKDKCNQEICEIKCKKNSVCLWDSKVNDSRHSIDCNNKCLNPATKCTREYCNKQCNECGNECKWVKDALEDSSGDYALQGRPFPPAISLMSTSYDGTKVLIRWNPPSKGTGGEILGYVALTYKTYDKNEGLKIDWISKGSCAGYCEYSVTNLDPDIIYTLGLKSYNSSGTGMLSNLLTFKTTKKIINTDIVDAMWQPSNTDIGNFEKCDGLTN